MAIQADSNPPSYVSTDSKKRDKNPDSSSTPYCTHGTSQTPHLDGYLQQPETKAALQALITALDSIADEKQCTTCAVEASSGILTRHVHGIRAARKSAQWSKEDKKALKAEVKRFKGLKKTNVKATWRGH